MKDKDSSPRYFVFRKGVNGCREDIRESHTHKLYEIFLCRSGKLVLTTGKRKCHVLAGDIAIIPKGVSHSVLYETDDCVRDLVQFSGDYVNPIVGSRLYRFFPNNVFSPRSATVSEQIDRLFQRFESESLLADDYSDEQIFSALNELLTLILRHPEYQGRTEMGGNRTSSQGINETVHYIAEHFADNISLEMMAERASVSPSYYSRTFRNSTGYGFKEYVNMVRTAEARRLLLGTNLPVNEISASCGFNDSNYFSTEFKNVYGVPPLTFRKTHRTKDSFSEYDHQSYVPDPKGSGHSVLRITSERRETMIGSHTTYILSAHTQKAKTKHVSFRILIPSRGENKLVGDFLTNSVYQVLYQLHLMTGNLETRTGAFAMVGVRAEIEPDESPKTAKVIGYSVFLTENEDSKLAKKIKTEVLTLDEWHTVSIDIGIPGEGEYRISLSVDGKHQPECDDIFYRHSDGVIHYSPTSGIALRINTLMRTKGTVFFDEMLYTEDFAQVKIKPTTKNRK